MIQGGEMGVQDYLAIAKRRWPVLVVLAFLGCVVAFGAARVLPKKFTSQTTVLVDPSRVSKEVVPELVNEDINHKLGSMKQQILSRSRLEPIIDKYGLFAHESKNITKDEQIEKLRSAIDVSPLPPAPGTDDRRFSGFHVSVTLDDPVAAQKICAEITTKFMEQNLQAGTNITENTEAFLSQNLADAKSKLDEQDKKLAAFKNQNMGALPDQTQMNLGLLTGLNTQLQATTQALGQAESNKAYTESLVSSQETTLKGALSGTSPQALDQQLTQMQDQLAALQARYTDEHPDVIKMKKSIEQLKAKMLSAAKEGDATPKTPASGSFEPPQLQQLRAQLRQNDMAVSELTKRQQQIQDQIRMIQGRLQMSPAVEEQYKDLTRDYQVAFDFYQDLLKKSNTAGMSSRLHQSQQDEQFQVVDPASLPEKPTFPDWRIFSAGGFVAGFILGIGLSALLEFQDKTLRTEREVEVFLKVPALAMLPIFAPTGQRRGSLLDAFRPTPKVVKG
jgi:polysaccharide chain length determinant protein (PEP-CTERM system associated)